MISEIIKTSYKCISPFLFAFYIRMFQNGEYSERWRKGIITPTFNKGNYRGITLINELSKVYSQNSIEPSCKMDQSA